MHCCILGRTFTYLKDFCKPCSDKTCTDLNVWLVRAKEFLSSRLRKTPNVQLSYPRPVFFGRTTLDLGDLIYGVTTSGARRTISSVRVVTLYFGVRASDEDPEKLSEERQMRVQFYHFWIELTKKYYT